ncbi:MAG TPA: S1C family serine protease [Microvirga sp.]|jgi:S1-C subfamily serine protease|nr:S1C family serine protease [Microvirga sp.]
MTATPTPLQDLSAGFTALVAEAASSVVAVHSRRSRSSGFLWRPGLVVTADEALADEGDVTVALPGGTRPAELVGRDPTTDIALLRIGPSELKPAPLERLALAPGAMALVVGAEDGDPTAALGMVSRTGGSWRSLRGGEIDARIELGVGLRRTAEGGLALDPVGRGFGMAVFGPRQRVLVIPSPTIERVAAMLERHGRVARGYVGLGLQQVALQDGGETGVMVMSVDPKGPGSAAGFRQGDVLVTCEGEPVRSVHALVRMLGPESVGRTVTFGIRRGGEPSEVSLIIGERPPP